MLLDALPDQTGRTVVVTGANSGIGYVTTRELARHGAEVMLACRDLDRGRDARERIRAAVPGARLEVARLDLADLASVHAFAAAWDRGPLDLLVNNAGVALIPFQRTHDGFEAQFGINVLGHFALTGLLLPHLLAAPDPRVVSVSSESQRWGRVTVDDLDGRHGYHPLRTYVRSKQAVVYLATHLQRHSAGNRWQLRSMSATPGFSATDVLTGGAHRHGPRAWRTLVAAANHLAKSADEGAASSLYAATCPSLPGGSYVAPEGLFELRGQPGTRNPHRAGYDPDTAEQLYARASDLTGVNWDLPDLPAENV